MALAPTTAYDALIADGDLPAEWAARGGRRGRESGPGRRRARWSCAREDLEIARQVRAVLAG